MKKLVVLLVACMLLGGCGSKQTGVATDDHTIHEDEAEEVLASYTTRSEERRVGKECL